MPKPFWEYNKFSTEHPTAIFQYRPSQGDKPPNAPNHRTKTTFVTNRSLNFVPVHWDG